jgi:hypothetical protein
MIEAMWSAVFDANNQMIGTGIVVISNGKIMGGDSSFTYIGDCAVSNGVVNAQLRVRKFSNVPGIVSITGLNDYHLSLSGQVGHDNMTLVGHPQSLPNVTVTVRLSRLEELNWTTV